MSSYAVTQKGLQQDRSHLAQEPKTIANRARFVVLDFFTHELVKPRSRITKTVRGNRMIDYTARRIAKSAFKGTFDEDTVEDLLDEMVEEGSLHRISG